MYKEIFKWVLLLISQPGKAWEMLAKKDEKEDDFLARFVYPLIGLVTLAAFLGIMFTRKEFDIQLALKASIRTLIATFGGFYLSAYLLNEIWCGVYKREKDIKLWQRFVGYSSALMFSLNMVLMLLPEFFFLRIFILYTFYIIWEGATPYMQIEEAERMKFVAVTTIVIIVLPYLLETVFYVLMPGFQF